MGLFEFLMLLVSVVIGLGLTEILGGVANLVRARDSVRFYWIHSFFQFGIFFALLQQWWESWDLQGLGQISFVAVLSLLASPVLLFLIAHLLYPDASEEADLRAYYYRQAPILWGLVAAATLEGTFLNQIIMGEPILQTANLTGLPMALICVALAARRDARTHALLAPIVLLLVILDTVLANPAISAG